MNINTLGTMEEYTIYSVKHSCQEFETLTDEQALKICEILAENKKKEYDHEEISDLQDEIDELQDEVDTLEERNYFLRSQNKDLEREIKELKDASNK
jgi:ubiquinone biosynthesis protein UbiJ